MTALRLADSELTLGKVWDVSNDVTLFNGDCRTLLKEIPDGSIQLCITSPPYNIGKKYERRVDLAEYLRQEKEVISLCVNKVRPGGSICWQVGSHIDQGEVFPLDILLYQEFIDRGLRLRNRIIWHFGHGLHCQRRFSGRYETILWFTKGDSEGDYTFNLDPVRVPQKYPNKKHFKGPKKGKLSGNPKGKNPGDLWAIPNVKHNHPEKTEHPCQFPIELVERLVLALTKKGDTVLDPYMGVGSSVIAAVMHGRRAIGAEIDAGYVRVANSRLRLFSKQQLKIRPMNRPIFEPSAATKKKNARSRSA